MVLLSYILKIASSLN